MLKAEGKINDVVIENMMNWHYSGFNVYCDKDIWPQNEEGLENLARYIIQAFFSHERMAYIAADESADGTAKVIYESKDAKIRETFDALDWLAQLVTHIRHATAWDASRKLYMNSSRGLMLDARFRAGFELSKSNHKGINKDTPISRESAINARKTAKE